MNEAKGPLIILIYSAGHVNLRLINSCALAGALSPNIFFPIHEYHPASNSVTPAFVSVAVGHPAQLSPGMSTPLNCHLCAVVTGLPIVL